MLRSLTHYSSRSLSIVVYGDRRYVNHDKHYSWYIERQVLVTSLCSNKYTPDLKKKLLRKILSILNKAVAIQDPKIDFFG